jgi:indolepyruvate ferredoxin oxidoreductase beta subunit
MEPLESLRYLEYLAPTGTVITASTPVDNIVDYPPVDQVLAQVRQIKGAIIVDADQLARQAGSARSMNMVIVGAASHWLPLKMETIEAFARSLFAAKGDKVVETNIKALRAGRDAAAAHDGA